MRLVGKVDLRDARPLRHTNAFQTTAILEEEEEDLAGGGGWQVKRTKSFARHQRSVDLLDISSFPAAFATVIIPITSIALSLSFATTITAAIPNIDILTAATADLSDPFLVALDARTVRREDDAELFAVETKALLAAKRIGRGVMILECDPRLAS